MTGRPPPRLLGADDVGAAARVLRDGGVIAMPTDTVYGLAASLDAPAAVARLYEVKDRPPQKAIPILLSDKDQLERVAAEIDDLTEALAARFWPGALTLVITAQPGLPAHVTTIDPAGRTTVAVRVPNDPVALAVITAAGGALAVTSANRSGEAPATSVEEILRLDTAGLDAVVDGGHSPIGQPSTILALQEGGMTILREGAIPEERIRQEIERVLPLRTAD